MFRGIENKCEEFGFNLDPSTIIADFELVSKYNDEKGDYTIKGEMLSGGFCRRRFCRGLHCTGGLLSGAGLCQGAFIVSPLYIYIYIYIYTVVRGLYIYIYIIYNIYIYIYILLLLQAICNAQQKSTVLANRRRGNSRMLES